MWPRRELECPLWLKGCWLHVAPGRSFAASQHSDLEQVPSLCRVPSLCWVPSRFLYELGLRVGALHLLQGVVDCEALSTWEVLSGVQGQENTDECPAAEVLVEKDRTCTVRGQRASPSWWPRALAFQSDHLRWSVHSSAVWPWAG